MPATNPFAAAGEDGQCLCSFGVCTRLNPEQGDQDWYEGHEPNLEKAGLPWFYFIPSPHKLVEKIREQYILQSEALWGKEHWIVKE